MSQQYCPGGQCGVRMHIAGSEAAIACNQLTQMKSRIGGIKVGGLTGAPTLTTSNQRSSWKDAGYEGEVVVDPAGCKCTGCISGVSTPVNNMSSEQVQSLIGGTYALNNRSSQPLKFDVEHTGDSVMVKLGQSEWELDGYELDESDMVSEFDQSGQPVYA